MENLPEIIDACNRLVVTWGDQMIRQEIAHNITGFSVIATIFIVLPAFGLGIWRLGTNREWW